MSVEYSLTTRNNLESLTRHFKLFAESTWIRVNDANDKMDETIIGTCNWLQFRPSIPT
jgi:hypothetical protein